MEPGLSAEDAVSAAAVGEALRAFGAELCEATEGEPGDGVGDARPVTEADLIAADFLDRARTAYQNALDRAATADLRRAAERRAVLAELHPGRQALRRFAELRRKEARLWAPINTLREALAACRLPAADPVAEAALTRAETAVARAVEVAAWFASDRAQTVASALGAARTALDEVNRRHTEERTMAALIGALRERLDLARAGLLPAEPEDGVALPEQLLDAIRQVEEALHRAAAAAAATVPGERLPAVRASVRNGDAGLRTLEAARENATRQLERDRKERQREQAKLADEARQLSRKLSRDIASFQRDMALARPSEAQCAADPVLAAGVDRVDAALQVAAAAARGGEPDRKQLVAQALQQGRSALGELAGVRAETTELTDAVAGFRRQLAETAPPEDRAAATAEAAAIAAERRDAWLALAAAEAALRTPGGHRARRVFAALGDGRAALVRLIALRRGEPVPLELATPDELARPDWERHPTSSAARFRFRGTGPAEVLVDRPEPGRPALVEFSVRPPTEDLSFLGDRSHLDFVSRTEAATESFEGKKLTGTAQGVFLLPIGITHLKVACDPKAKWTLRLAPTTEAPEVTGRLRGQGPVVLRCTGRGARLLRAQALAKDENSYIGYVDAAGERRSPRFGGFLGGLAADLVANGIGEARGERWVEGPGLVVVDSVGRWEVETTSEGSVPKAARPKAPTAELHRELRELVRAREPLWELMALRLYQAHTGAGRMHGTPYLRAVINEVYLAAEAEREQARQL
ncbi:hypothetical protein [Kitasatospora cystarginea]|uniref:hypothetical protein n=1 Tax=Kitasatospora cystarginea TaxID=58350 RepID=UPI0031D6753B